MAVNIILFITKQNKEINEVVYKYNTEKEELMS